MRFLFFLLLLISACAPKTELEVEYDMVRVPSEYFRSLSVLGVTKGEGFSSNEMKYFFTQMQQCKRLREARFVDNLLRSDDKNPKKLAKEIEKEIEGWNDAKTVDGVLSIKLLKDDQKASVKDAKLVSFKESLDHDWYPTYGYEFTNRFGFSGFEELAPKFKTDSFGVGLRKNRHEIKIQYVLYNKSLKKVVVIDDIAGRAGVNVYTEQPAIDHNRVKEALMDSLLDRLASKLCPIAKKAVERQLVSGKNPKKVDMLISEGIDLADDGSWDKAADKWRSALAQDKDNQFAHNNLGVYEEMFGNVGDAAGHFRRSRLGKQSRQIPNGYYEDLVETYVPEFKLKDTEPRIFVLSSGNWAYAVGGQVKKMKVGAKYPVYRVHQLRAGSLPADGIEYTELGSVQVYRIDKGALAVAMVRIEEFISPYNIEIGDMIVVK